MGLIIGIMIMKKSAMGDESYTCSTVEDLVCQDDCPTCDAADHSDQRVRRELRDLSEGEWQAIVNAFWTMKETSTADGQDLYGTAFKSYDYFVVKHVAAFSDSRGDQNHFSDAFPTWHAAYVLEFERSLLAIDSSIEALPYWDTSVDSSSVFTDEYFGSVPGTGDDYVVTDGMFAYWPIEQNFSIDDWEMYVHTGVEDATLENMPIGMLRGYVNKNPAVYVTRWGEDWSYPDFDNCAEVDGCWGHWYKCIDGGLVNNVWIAQKNFHGGAHKTIGGGRPTRTCGDFADIASSPNDPIFMFHHANLDRNRMKFMSGNYDKKDYFWGYPTEGLNVPETKTRYANYGGLGLNEVASALWPFSSEDLGLDNIESDGLTHGEILCHLSPYSAPYMYADPHD